MHHLLAQTARQQHGLITTAQILRLGVDKRELGRLVRAGSLVRVRRGVLTTRQEWEAADEYVGRPLLQVRAAHLRMGVAHRFSHDSAALLHGLPLPDARTSLVHVTRLDVDGDRCKGGVKHHCASTDVSEHTEIDGLPALSRARTALDLAREHGLVAGVAACDAALALDTPRSELEAAAQRMASWPMITTVRQAIDLSDPGAESYLESWVRVLVARLGRGRPETQFGLRVGGRSYFCDLRIGRHVIECDGQVKLRAVSVGGLAEDPERALREEKRRQDLLSGLKIGFSRVTYAECHEPDQLLSRLEREIRSTEELWGSDISNLAPYRIQRAPRPYAS